MGAIDLNYEEYSLDNGLRVALQRTPTETVHGRLRVFHGALHEKKGEQGLANLTEHVLVSGGSENISPDKATFIRTSFPYFNAFTYQIQTKFFVDILPQDTETFLFFISDSVFRPIPDIKIFEIEKQRSLRENADERGSPIFKHHETYREAAYGKNSPYLHSTIGKYEDIASATIEKAMNFHSRGYSPNNADLILIGNIPEDTEKMIGRYFGTIPRGNGERLVMPGSPSIKGPKMLHFYAPDLYDHGNPEESNAGINMIFSAPHEKKKDSVDAMVLAALLVGNMDSRLFKTISQENGLAYDFNGGYDGSHNAGFIHFGGKVHAPRIDRAIELIFEEMSKLKSELVPKISLLGLKRNMMYNIAKIFETNEGRLGAIENYWDTDMTPEIALANMDKITPESIREAANKYLPSGRATGNYVLMIRDPLKGSTVEPEISKEYISE